MAIQVVVTGDARKITRDLSRFSKNLKFAHAVALTRTAQSIKSAEQREFLRKLKNPKSFTVDRSLYLEPATKAKQRAEVGIKDRQNRYLRPLIRGGGRNLKGLEVGLQGRGLMRRNEYAIPGFGAPKRQLSGAMVRKILGSVGTRNGRFFVAKINGTRGVWERKGSRIRPMAIFTTRDPTYRKTIDFYGVAERTARKEFPRQWRKAVQQYAFKGRGRSRFGFQR